MDREFPAALSERNADQSRAESNAATAVNTNTCRRLFRNTCADIDDVDAFIYSLVDQTFNSWKAQFPT